MDGLWSEILEIGSRHGLVRLGVARAEVMQRARRVLIERREAGYADTMQFTYRNPERSTDPSRTLPGARSLIVAARPVPDETVAAPERRDATREPVASVARYARRDHYGDLRAGLTAIARHLEAAGHRSVVVADDNALVDREAAWLAGIGWYGKNANLLVPGVGSHVVLGTVITAADLEAHEPVPDGCGGCRRCLDACPTQAIIAPGVVDAGRCLAWILQRPGPIPLEFRVAVGDRIYGCDDCQEVCPPTLRLGHRHEVASRDATVPVQRWVPVIELLDSTDDEILERYGRWYIAGRDPRWLRRNALVVLGNVGIPGDPEIERVLTEAVRSSDPILRSHGAWAAQRLGFEHVAVAADLTQDPETDRCADLSDLTVDVQG